MSSAGPGEDMGLRTYMAISAQFTNDEVAAPNQVESSCAKRARRGQSRLQCSEVDPSRETESGSYTCRSMIFAPQVVDSPLISESAGEAEAGSAGEQPAEE